MNMRGWIGTAILLVQLCVGAKAAPLEAYGQLPTTDHVVISPDGSRLAFITQVGPKRQLVVFSFTTQQSLLGLDIGDVKVRGLSWVGNNHLLVTSSTTGRISFLSGPRREWGVAQYIDVDKRQVNVLQMPPRDHEQTLNTVYGLPLTRILDGHPTVITESVHFPLNQGELMLFAKDLISGRTWYVEEGSPNARDWTVDASGNAIAQTDYSELNKRWSLRLNRDGKWPEAFGIDAPIDEPSVEGISADGQSLVIGMLENDQVVFKTIALATGSFGPPLITDQLIDQVIVDSTTSRVIGGRRTGAQIENIFFDARDQNAWNKVVAFFPHADVRLQSWSDDRSKIVVEVSGKLDGDAYRLVDLTDGSAQLIGQAYASIDVADVASVTPITYSAADGQKIPAYLTLPNNKPEKNLPLIVLPHGGPQSRDMPGFDWWSQALASRGYAVLQPQFRGSGGWGRDMVVAGFGEFGRKMQTDLSDGVRDLAAKGIIDPKRVCIVGGSYGGYAALAGVTLDSGVYRCVVSVAGLSDIREFLSWIQSNQHSSDSQSIRYWDRFLGTNNPDDVALDAISPIKHIDKVSVPVLLIHGRDDTVVPIRQSKLMNDALKSAGKPVQFVEMKGEDHWLSRSETRMQMLNSTVKFLEENNPPN